MEIELYYKYANEERKHVIYQTCFSFLFQRSGFFLKGSIIEFKIKKRIVSCLTWESRATKEAEETPLLSCPGDRAVAKDY